MVSGTASRLLCVAAAVAMAEAGSMYIASLCQDQTCDHKDWPILDYDPDTKTCNCRARPCWDDNGITHSCKHSPQKPYLYYEYLADGKLFCDCRSTPHYSPPYISKHLCAAQACDNQGDRTVLDYDYESGKCICRSDPCALLSPTALIRLTQLSATGKRTTEVPRRPFANASASWRESGP